MTKERKAKGRTGEDMAATALEEAGYIIVKLNYRYSGGEIDIIAQKGESLYFVEVRAKTTAAFGTPAESITAAKKAKIKNTAALYLSENPFNGDIHFLFALVNLKNKSLTLLEDSFI